MEIVKLLPLFLFFSLLCIFVAAEPPACPAFSQSQCLDSGPTVRFPFQNRPGPCGYPGFNLSCGTNNDTILHLHSLPFIVREIDYEAQEIRINGPDSTCLAGEILSLNLSGTPFRGAFYQEFTFFSCEPANRSEVEPVTCLSNSTRFVFASSASPTLASRLFGSCEPVETVSVPVQSPGYGAVPSSNLDQDLVLRWDLPACRDCESRGGWCGLNDTSALQITCFSKPGFSLGESDKIILMVFALLCVLACFFYACYCIYNMDVRVPKIIRELRNWTRKVSPEH